MTGDWGGSVVADPDGQDDSRGDRGSAPTGTRPAGDVVLVLPSAQVWRAGLVLLGVAAVGLLARFVITDGGSVCFTVLMSWFAALAMAPVVDRLARRMRRGVATALVMAGAALVSAVFLIGFGSLFVDQSVQLLQRLPDLADGVLGWANRTFSLSLTTESILSSFEVSPQQLAAAAGAIGAGLLTFLGSAVGGLFSLFTFGMFVFYISARMPELELWLASRLPARTQSVAAGVWRLTAQKTGSYVGARVVLATINSVTTAVVFAVIGMPSWLPLALWTGVVAQFVPTIGTYVSIVLPVLVGLVSPEPWVGIVALVWAVLYQQVENLFIEPRISARAVDVHPAVSFGAVLLGAALFGAAGAFLAVPVVAMLLALLDVYGQRHELLPEVRDAVDRGRGSAHRRGGGSP